jgi:hypothetical protein
MTSYRTGDRLEPLILFEIENEDRGRGGRRCHAGLFLSGHSRARMFADEVQYMIDLIFIGPDHEGGVAASEEAPGTCETRCTEVLFEERIDDPIRVLILNDRDDELLHAANLPDPHGFPLA